MRRQVHGHNTNTHQHPSNTQGSTTIVGNPTPYYPVGYQPVYHPNSFFAGHVHPAYQQPNQHHHHQAPNVHGHGAPCPF